MSHHEDNSHQTNQRKQDYQVLARKYRPRDFNSLIGQDLMVQTMRNAFATGRIAHAWIFSGVRGVGKTTTARILARALNYKTDTINHPSIDFPVEGEHCRAILEGYHVDVIEMDAASHTGIDDIREVIDKVHYAPACSRFKVYIIDEVHMLSTQAFNGLLKTLEEPPAHVKFILATTEIRKVPVTIVSRCQRFDLRRIDPELMQTALEHIVKQEKVEAEKKALFLITRAAQGSMRDAQSILDQAILYGSGSVREKDVRSMLGLVDRSRIMDLFENLMRGNIAAVLEEFQTQKNLGAEPVSILMELAEFTHSITRISLTEKTKEDSSFEEEEGRLAYDLSQKLSLPVLSRTWQMLLKAIAEVQEAPDPFMAAEMALIRIAHTADLPTLDQALKILQKQKEIASSTLPIFEKNSQEENSIFTSLPFEKEKKENSIEKIEIRSLHDLAKLAEKNRDGKFKAELKKYISLVRIEENKIDIALKEGAPPHLINDVSLRLKEWTGSFWQVSLSSKQGKKTLAQEEEEKNEKMIEDAGKDPSVRSMLESIPGAQIVSVRTLDKLDPSSISYETDLNQDKEED